MTFGCEVLPSWAKLCVWKRILKSQNKERPFHLSAAILEKIIIRFRQKMVPIDRLVDTFDLIYDTTKFGQLWNLTFTWRRSYGPCHDISPFANCIFVFSQIQTPIALSFEQIADNGQAQGDREFRQLSNAERIFEIGSIISKLWPFQFRQISENWKNTQVWQAIESELFWLQLWKISSFVRIDVPHHTVNELCCWHYCTNWKLFSKTTR